MDALGASTGLDPSVRASGIHCDYFPGGIDFVRLLAGVCFPLLFLCLFLLPFSLESISLFSFFPPFPVPPKAHPSSEPQILILGCAGAIF